MFVPFEQLPASARLWVFQASKKLSSQQITIIEEHLKLFTQRWAAHGQPLRSSFVVKDEQFVILAADEAFQAASGCSIDDSTRAIREIESTAGIQLMSRDMVWFKLGDQLTNIKVSDLKETFHENIWNEKTLTFNTLVSTKGQLDNEWLVPAGSTWLKRYMANEHVTS